jgi:hypothetical protein
MLFKMISTWSEETRWCPARRPEHHAVTGVLPSQGAFQPQGGFQELFPKAASMRDAKGGRSVSEKILEIPQAHPPVRLR